MFSTSCGSVPLATAPRRCFAGANAYPVITVTHAHECLHPLEGCLALPIMAAGSILAEGVVEAVEQRPEGVERHGSATRLDEHLGRHSRNDLDTVDRGDPRILHSNLCRVIWLIGALIEKPVGRDMRHSSLEPWYAALVVGQEIHVGAQSGTDHIDVLGPDARSHDETILPGNQIHEGCAGADHATGGMDPQFGYHAVLGRLDRRSQQLILRRL